MFGSAPFSSSAFSGEAAASGGESGAELELPALSLTIFGGARAILSLPKPVITASGPTFHASVIMNLPAITLSAYGGYFATLELPSFGINASGHDATGENAANLALPTPMLTGHFGGKAALQMPTAAVTMAGTFYVVGRAALQLPAFSISASGTAGATAQVSITLGTPEISGHFGGVSSITVDGLSITASGKGGAVGRAEVELPLFELTATATAQNHGSVEIQLPPIQMLRGGTARLTLPGFSLTAIGTAVVTANYEAYAVNLLHKGTDSPIDEVTRYTNFPFDRIVRYQNSYFGVAADGLYLLEGTTDHATPPAAIPWVFKTHLTDLENPKEKTVVSAYFGGRMGRSETITLYSGDGKTTKAYRYTTARGSNAQNHREKFGRGIKARYFAVGANGADVMELDNIEFNIHTLTKRI